MGDITPKFGLAALLFVFSEIYHSLGVLFIVLVLASTIDYISGFMAAVINKELNSRVSLVGIYRKFLILSLPALAVLIQLTFKYAGWFDTTAFYTGVTSWLIATEALSIIENMARSGVPVPSMLVNVLAVFGAQHVERNPHKIKKDRRRNSR